ncbi:MAG: hypothetical protein RMK18_11795 [Armatimonadota bacterium]|nr:hypothetical protein [Armatimonadota bacterium]MDW8026529.1 hypothetical protein [Armatimonadota bacterium]
MAKARGSAEWRDDLKIFFTDYIMPILIAFVLMFFGIGLAVVMSLLILIGLVAAIILVLALGIGGGIVLALMMASVRMAIANLLFGAIMLAMAVYCLFNWDVVSAILGFLVGLMIGWVARPWRDIARLGGVASSHASEFKREDGKIFRVVLLTPESTLGFEPPLWQSAILWSIVVLSIMVGGFVLKWWGFAWGVLAAASLWSGIWWLFVEAEANAMLFGQLLPKEYIERNKLGQLIVAVLRRAKMILRTHFLRWA